MQTGNFGKVREAYAEARQLFLAEVLDFLWSRVAVAEPHVLDLGCGTGIATRQLAERESVTIVGCDVDNDMITEAKRTSPALSYFAAPASKLPFDSNSFDLVTAFSSFHWFTDDESLAEIQRVLKSGGMLGVANKNDIGGFRVGYRKKLEELLGREVTSPKQGYDPEAILRKAGFSDVAVTSFFTEEHFDLTGALQHIQSASIWAEVPDNKQGDAAKIMRQHILDKAVAGKIARQLEVLVVIGTRLLS